MDEKKRAEINIAIGKILGFKYFDPGKDSYSPGQWIYPHSWDNARTEHPTTVLPDFLKMIDVRFCHILEVRGVIPKDRFTDEKMIKRHNITP